MEYRVGDALFNIGLMYSIHDDYKAALKIFELALLYLPDDEEIQKKIEECRNLVEKKE